MPCSLGVIGLGQMAQAILLPLLQRGQFSADEVFAVVAHEESVHKVIEKFPKGLRVVACHHQEALEVWDAPIQLLGVKPQQLNQVEVKLKQLNKKSSQSKRLLISLLAGVTLTRLAKVFPDFACVRAIPNAPALVEKGLTGLAWDQGVTKDQKQLAFQIFDPISEVIQLTEEQMDPFLALTSSGPAYVAVIIEALADGAVAAGLPRTMSYELACKTLAGSVSLLQQKTLHPGELKDMVASPGGTTIAALRYLEQAGVRSALIETVVAAAERSRGMLL